MNIDLFYSRYVDHLRSRKKTIQSFIVTSAAEAWFSMEAAALADACRDELGIDGQLEGYNGGSVPRWLIAAERGKVDLWIEDQSEQKPPRAVAIEFKLIHNNKNFDAKIEAVHRDLTERKVPGGTLGTTEVTQVAIVIAIYHRFVSGQDWNYRTLGGSTTPVAAKDFLRALTKGLRSSEGKEEFRSTSLEPLFGLDRAHYTESGQGAGVWISLVRRKS